MHELDIYDIDRELRQFKQQGAETYFGKPKVQRMAKPKYKKHEFITKKEKERQEKICGAQLLCWTYEVVIKDHIHAPPVQDARCFPCRPIRKCRNVPFI